MKATNTIQEFDSMIDNFLDSIELSNSVLGKVSKTLLSDYLGKMSEKIKQNGMEENLLQYKKYSKYSNKWARLINRDVEKLNLTKDDRRVITYLFLYSLLPRMIDF
jgi:hypothetical protein